MYNEYYLLGMGRSSGWVNISWVSIDNCTSICGLSNEGNGTSSTKWVIYLSIGMDIWSLSEEFNKNIRNFSKVSKKGQCDNTHILLFACKLNAFLNSFESFKPNNFCCSIESFPLYFS